MKEIDRMLERWLERFPRARTAHRFDAQYRAQFTFMSRTFTAMAMQDEGIPEPVRLRIIRTLIYGAPDETEALARMDRMAAEVDKLATTTTASFSLDEVWRP